MTSCARATHETEAPGARASSRIRCRSAILHTRRFARGTASAPPESTSSDTFFAIIRPPPNPRWTPNRRQPPPEGGHHITLTRDLCDVMQLFAHEGITAGIRRAFVVYLGSHNRPVHEVLFPTLRDVRQEFENNFAGMTVEPVELDTLMAAREQMVRELQQGLSADERRFLLSLVSAEPEWALLDVPHLGQLPGLRWKLQNLERLQKSNARKFAEQSDTLARLLG